MSGPEDHLQAPMPPQPPPPQPQPPSMTPDTTTTVPYPDAEDDDNLHDVDMNGTSTIATAAPSSNDEPRFHRGHRHKQRSSLFPSTDRTNTNTDSSSSSNNNTTTTTTTTTTSTFLTSADVSSIQRLDADYEKALLRREIGWNARYISVRQNAGLSLWTFFLIIMCGTIFFEMNTNWTISESLLFSVYTITTVGYGNHPIPKENRVLLFISVYIFIGIAMLTILAAQLYQWLVLELTWAQYERDSNQFIKRHKQNIRTSEEMGATIGEMPSSSMQRPNEYGDYHNDNNTHDDDENNAPKKSFCDKVFDTLIQVLNKVQAYIKNNPSGQLIVVMVPFSLLIILGALVVGSIERWNAIESIYFAVVSMTTVGFGDYYPGKFASTWFCIVWLPFSVGFLSLYLGSIANLYIDISQRNVKRIERKLHRQINLERDAEHKEREEAIARGTSAGFGLDIHVVGGDGSDVENSRNMSPTPGREVSHLQQPRHQNRREMRASEFSTLVADDSIEMDDDQMDEPLPDSRRQNIITNSGMQHFGDGTSDNDDHNQSESEEAMKSMRNVIAAVKLNMATPRRTQGTVSGGIHGSAATVGGAGLVANNDFLNVKSTKHYHTTHGVEKKPTFALRVLLQERFCHIIAKEIAGYQSNVDIKNNTLSVTIDSLKYTADKWSIPRRARKSFRAVAFEVLYFCGERDLIVRGAEAVFDLRPHEAQGLFAPLLAAFGDADTMEAWLMRTQTLAENELYNFSKSEMESSSDANVKLHQIELKRADKITMNMTASPNVKRNVIGNAVKNQTS